MLTMMQCTLFRQTYVNITEIVKYVWLAYVIKKGGHGFLRNAALPRGWGECFTGLRVIEADLDERSDH